MSEPFPGEEIFSDREVRVAKLLAMQRRHDLLDEREGWDGMTRESYWNAITGTERAMMCLRAQSVLYLIDGVAEYD